MIEVSLVHLKFTRRSAHGEFRVKKVVGSLTPKAGGFLKEAEVQAFIDEEVDVLSHNGILQTKNPRYKVTIYEDR